MSDFDVYAAVGGIETCRKLSKAFYARVARDPVLRPLFPGKSFTCAIEAFAAYLNQFFGGPSADSQRRRWLSLEDSHARFKIGPKEREAWLRNMNQALEDAAIQEPARSAFRYFFELSSAYILKPRELHWLKYNSPIEYGISLRWNMQVQIDDAVAAIHEGDTDRAIALAELDSYPPSVVAGLLGEMIVSWDTEVLDYVGSRLTSEPQLIEERYAGRTLLHVAAAEGRLPTVELLLRLGANPNALDGGRHTPLYSVANECTPPKGADVVRALVQAGAAVDANDGVKHCTALHMAARRGNVEVAEALLDCGARIESRDSLGQTPLRRAVNCGKIEVVSLLLRRGAYVHSQARDGSSPLLVARTPAMRQLLSH